MQQKGTKSKKLIYGAIFVLFFVAFYIIGQFGGDKLGNLVASSKTNNENIEQNWAKKTYGSLGLTVELPIEAKKIDVPLAESVKELIDKMEGYSYSSGKGFEIFINSVRYKNVLDSVSLVGAIEGMVNEIKRQPNVKEFNYSIEDTNITGISGTLIKGAYKYSETDTKMKAVLLVKELTLWQVIVSYRANNETEIMSANRIIESIKIEENAHSKG